MGLYKRINYVFLFLCISAFVIQPASAYSYSVTTINNYNLLDDLTQGASHYARVEYWLHDVAGWSESFYATETNVDETDFGTLNSGYQGLDSADFHYHLGHGVDDVGTELALYNWAPGYNYNDVRAQDVYKKWDNNNEWVMLHSCYVLDDYDDWADALKYSHGIMGFKTKSYTSTELLNQFFTQAINNDETICDSWYTATKAVFNTTVTAVIITDTDNQMVYDHLNGQGSMEPNESPDDSGYAYDYWSC